MESLVPTLRNNLNPLEYRNMLIKSILIPTLMYGSELFGMNRNRKGTPKRVLDNGL